LRGGSDDTLAREVAKSHQMKKLKMAAWLHGSSDQSTFTAVQNSNIKLIINIKMIF